MAAGESCAAVRVSGHMTAARRTARREMNVDMVREETMLAAVGVDDECGRGRQFDHGVGWRI